MVILNVGTYPPKQCGIASFSKDLRDNLLECGIEVPVVAVSDSEYSYSYPAEVLYEIRQDVKKDYLSVAGAINNSQQIDLVIIQHEYGIFGGADGEYILNFISYLNKPYLLVAHTILPRPSRNQLFILQKLAQQAARVICMTKSSARLLERVYAVPREKVYVIYHGVPLFQAKNRDYLKQKHGCSGRQVITTFGLIGPGKGLENGIKAIKYLVNKYPEVLYLIAGRTHPMLLKREGESYRGMLTEMVTDMGLEKQVRFVNHFLELDELGEYLYMTDIYLSPYPNRDQAVSGTLSYAIGCGRAIVSTPYEYALDMLSEGERGLIAQDTNPEAIAELLDKVLGNPQLKSHLEKKTAQLGRTLRWPHVAKQYANLAKSVLRPSMAGIVS
ncbi:MAG TPA: glycosyltransferase [Syntrophomonadaceae bacterium]|nr:glycosyltransferase [Syntrophomonadaceae bacterium]